MNDDETGTWDIRWSCILVGLVFGLFYIWVFFVAGLWGGGCGLNGSLVSLNRCKSARHQHGIQQNLRLVDIAAG